MWVFAVLIIGGNPLVWLCTKKDDREVTRAVSVLAISSYRKVPKIGQRCDRVGNACVGFSGEGSGNILMKPNDQYLCIVANQGRADSNKVFLPFEGDQRTAVILSKAFLLAEDTKIKDKTILKQIR